MQLVCYYLILIGTQLLRLIMVRNSFAAGHTSPLLLFDTVKSDIVLLKYNSREFTDYEKRLIPINSLYTVPKISTLNFP